MPKVLDEQGFQFSFFSSDGSEPPHVHVRKGEGQAKWWLDPIREAWSTRFKASERSTIRRIIVEYQGYLLAEWTRFFSQD